MNDEPTRGQQPSQAAPQNQKRGVPGWAIALGAVVLIAAVGIVIGIVKTKNDVEAITGAVKTGSTATAPLNPTETGIDYSKVDPTTLTVGEFYNDAKYPEAYRVRWARDIIKERAAAAIPKLNALRARNGNRPLGELVPASENNTGDEILVQRDLGWFIASTEPDPNLGRKLFSAVMDDDHPGFSTMLDTIDGGRSPVTETYIVYGGPMMGGGGARTQETPTFYQTSVGDYVPNGTPSKIVKSTGTSTGTLNLVTFKFVEGNWMQANTLHEGDPDWITKPQAVSVR